MPSRDTLVCRKQVPHKGECEEVHFVQVHLLYRICRQYMAWQLLTDQSTAKIVLLCFSLILQHFFFPKGDGHFSTCKSFHINNLKNMQFSSNF